MTLRLKLFLLISCAVAAPLVALAVWLEGGELAVLEAEAATKAQSLAHILADLAKPAVAFDDSQSAREALASIATDGDVAEARLYRQDGSLIASHERGDLHPDGSAPAHAGDGGIRVTIPVVADEGPRGTLTLVLSTARLEASSAATTRRIASVGAVGVALGCLAAWLVGASIGRRLGRVQAHANRVARGDLAQTAVSDVASDEIGELARAVSQMVAVVEEKVSERTAELAASREQFRALVEGTRSIPWQMSIDAWRMTYVGPQAAAIVGGTPADWLDPAYWRARIPAEDAQRARASLQAALASGQDQDCEFRFRRDDGRTLWLRAVVSHTAGGGPPVAGGFMFDVTRQRELEHELQQAQKLESVGRLAAGVAHEINTPIQFVSDSVYFVQSTFEELVPLIDGYRRLHASIAGDGNLAVPELGQLEEQADLDYAIEHVPKALTRSLDGIQRVARIVRSMKEFAHPDATSKAEADLNRALETTLAIATNEYKYVADVVTDFAPVPPVRCHVGELNQVFLNIIVNAAHAIADANKGSERRGVIKVSSRVDGGDVVVSIADSGQGIPASVRGRIFDPFFTTKEVGRGTGQGLAIARTVVVDKHQGSLTFETVEGRGTTFHIRVPAAGGPLSRVAVARPG
ncbi:MAG: ATP-binding protein [Myxococcota bacterium]